MVNLSTMNVFASEPVQQEDLYFIINDEIAQKAAKMEIIRRYYDSLYSYKKGIGSQKEIEVIKKLMNNVSISINDREIVKYALEKSEKEATIKGINALASLLNKKE